jgi:LPS sulfotransferase NodH
LTQTYPVLSHRLKRSPDADLLAFRRNRYIAGHHQLPVVAVNGAGLSMDDRPAILQALSDFLKVPFFRVASSRALADFTGDWEYRPLQSPTSGANLTPLDPDAFTGALGDWIETRRRDGALRIAAAEPAVSMAKPLDPPFFASHPIDREVLVRVLETYDDFCVAGHRSSVTFVPKYLDAVGKTYRYVDSLSPRALEAAAPFDCLLACGPMGAYDGAAPAFAVMGAGWPTPMLNAPASLADVSFRGAMKSCRPGEWYSILPRPADHPGEGGKTSESAPDPAAGAAGQADAGFGVDPPPREAGDDGAVEPRWLRLKAFPRAQIRETRSEIRGVTSGEWPALEGCLVVLFTARSGSTFLTRELEYLYDLGRMGETLNPAQVKGRPVADLIAHRRDRWFGFKAGLPGVVAGEFYGFFDAYLERTSFLRLVRRDIVGQAISFGKASQSGQWHAGNRPTRRPVYDAAKIAKAIRKVAAGIEQLRRYAEICQRPSRTVVYEDFAEGDFSSVTAACDDLGIPRREAGSVAEHRGVERMSDETNDAWRSRFMEDIDEETQAIVDRYLDAIRM